MNLTNGVQFVKVFASNLSLLANTFPMKAIQSISQSF